MTIVTTTMQIMMTEKQIYDERTVGQAKRDYDANIPDAKLSMSLEDITAKRKEKFEISKRTEYDKKSIDRTN